MSKNTKIIIGVIAGVVLLGICLCACILFASSLLSTATEEARRNLVEIQERTDDLDLELAQAQAEITITAATTPGFDLDNLIEKKVETEYLDPINNLQFLYPADWDQQVTGESVNFLSKLVDGNDIFRDNVGIIVQDLSAQPGDFGMAQFEQISLDQLEANITGYSLISKKDATLDKLPARRLDYTGTLEGNTLRYVQVWTIQDRKAYIITFVGNLEEFAEKEKQLNRILDSFVLL